MLALGIRVLFILQWLKLPYGQIPFLDGNSYDRWAQSIASGHWLRQAAFYQSPLYPYLLALIYMVFGHSLAVVGYLQGLLGALTCALVARTAEVAFGKRAGLFAGLLMCFDRVLIFYVAPVIKETLGVFLLSAFVYYVFTREIDKKWRSGIFAGLLLGAAVLVRSNLLLLPLGLLLWDLWARRGFSWRKYSALLVGAGLAILPVTLHNWIVSDDFVPVVYSGGFNFYIGNSSWAANFKYPGGISTDPLSEEGDTTRIAEAAAQRKLKPSEVSGYWFNKGIQFLEKEPLALPALLADKVWFFWMNREIPDSYDSDFVAKNFSATLRISIVSFSLLAFLAAIGCVLGWREQGSDRTSGLVSLLFIYMLSVVSFYVTDRYRLPAIVFLAPLAGNGIYLAIGRLRNSDWIPIAKAFAAAIPFLVIGYYPMQIDPGLEAYNWGTYASLSSDAGRDSEAVSAIEKALASNANRVDSSAYIKASTSYERLGKLTEAESLLKRATETYPDDGLAFFNYGRFKFEHGDFNSSLDLYKKAASVSPWLYQPYIGLTVLFLKKGDRAEALRSVKKGLSLSPDNRQLQELLKIAGE